MGTHGRNTITKWECYITGKRYRNHLCHEQTMDGHYAADDFTLPFLKEGVITNYSRPTMNNETDELDHYNYSHIDYTRNILYTSWLHPIELLCIKIIDEIEEGDIEEVNRVKENTKLWMENLKKVEDLGWKVIFNVTRCPKEYRCINSTDKTINQFIKEEKKNREIWEATDIGILATPLTDSNNHVYVKYLYDKIVKGESIFE